MNGYRWVYFIKREGGLNICVREGTGPDNTAELLLTPREVFLLQMGGQFPVGWKKMADVLHQSVQWDQTGCQPGTWQPGYVTLESHMEWIDPMEYPSWYTCESIVLNEDEFTTMPQTCATTYKHRMQHFTVQANADFPTNNQEVRPCHISIDNILLGIYPVPCLASRSTILSCISCTPNLPSTNMRKPVTWSTRGAALDARSRALVPLTIHFYI